MKHLVDCERNIPMIMANEAEARDQDHISPAPRQRQNGRFGAWRRWFMKDKPDTITPDDTKYASYRGDIICVYDWVYYYKLDPSLYNEKAFSYGHMSGGAVTNLYSAGCMPSDAKFVLQNIAIVGAYRDSVNKYVYGRTGKLMVNNRCVLDIPLAIAVQWPVRTLRGSYMPLAKLSTSHARGHELNRPIILHECEHVEFVIDRYITIPDRHKLDKPHDHLFGDLYLCLYGSNYREI